MMMNQSPWRSVWAVLGCVLLLLAFVSERSGYSLRDVKSINWDIALMLSPWGLIHNLLYESDHYLRPYYWESSVRGDLYDDPLLMILITLTMVVALTGLWLVRRALRVKP